MRLVLDASLALSACQVEVTPHGLANHELVAPPLLWSEFHCALRQKVWRGETNEANARDIRCRFSNLDVTRRTPKALYETAYAIATEFGWAKTYDAEFLALARIEGGRVLTTDLRLRRGADRSGLVIRPDELPNR